MPKILFLFSLVLVVSSMPGVPGAEPIQHHGYVVNAQGNSRECLACHDGSMAKAVSSCLNGRCPVGGSHPVDTPYPPAGHEGEYVATVSGSIRLLNGQVTCISCHNLQNPQPDHPSVDLATTNLCLNCHRK